MVGSKIESAASGHHHRSTLKQKNKPFKGASRSKSKGREAKGAGVSKAGGVGLKKMNKKDRRNQAKLIQMHKREVLQKERKAYKGREGMPRVICVLPISAQAEEDIWLPWETAREGEGMVYCEGSRQLLSFHLCSRRKVSDKAEWLSRLIQMSQVADCILVLGKSSASDANAPFIDEIGMEAFSILRAIGISSVAALVTNNLQKNEKDNCLRLLQAECSSIQRVFSLDQSAQKMLHQQQQNEMERHLCEQHLNGISWREQRAYMIAENIEYSPGNSHFKVTGHVRGGRPFSPNRLIHIPQLASNFIVDRITITCAGTGAADVMTDGVMERREELAEQLKGEEEGDLNSKEAMFAAAESMINAVSAEGQNIIMNDAPKSFKLVPKGTSSYQAAWLSDVENEEEELEEVIMQSDKEEESTDLNNFMEEEEEADHEEELAKHHLQFNERHFPDEITLDPHISAKNRLQKYRGCVSLRTGQWDQNEGLPFEYGKIYQFADYKQSRKAALEDTTEVNECKQVFGVGMKVTLWIRIEQNSEVEAKLTNLLQQQQQQIFMTIFGLLRHEQQMTIVNFTFSKPKSAPPAYHLRNKQQLIAIIGFRRFLINPILSQHTPNSNLHKMIRQVGEVDGGEEWPSCLVGTIYAPVTHAPTPILLFDQNMTFIGVGSVQDLNPHRIILKRITLTGIPFKTHKRTAVVRFMFSNPADVNWFRPVELCSRLGARGHIRESLGTHGYMKCIFDKIIFQHDTIAMHLYKRVFPKYTTKSI